MGKYEGDHKKAQDLYRSFPGKWSKPAGLCHHTDPNHDIHPNKRATMQCGWNDKYVWYASASSTQSPRERCESRHAPGIGIDNIGDFIAAVVGAVAPNPGETKMENEAECQ